MKRKSIISLLIFCMSLGMVTTSCEDMLTSDSERHSYEVAQDTLYSYWGILKSLQNVAERYVILGECRGDLVTSTGYVSDTIAAIVNFGQKGTAAKYKDGASKYLKASDYYHIINSCNAYIAHCDTFQTTGTNQKYMIKEYAQVQAIRAWTYMQLVQVYGEVPFYTKPLLTTKEIDEFWASDYPTANAGNLVDLLAPELINMEFVEKIYGFPHYAQYGRTSAVCHSSLCMFPVSIVLGDLYLMEGSAASCAKAAQHYYNYLNTENGGPLLSNTYCYGNLTERTPLPGYYFRGTIPYTSKGEVSKTNEAITCIPSSTNKLWGTVLTDVNRLFGFEAEIRVTTYETGDEDEEQSTATTASVSLSHQEDPELVASAGYDSLCMKQDFEIYIGDPEKPDQAIISTMPKVGDARQYWNSQIIFMNEMDKMDTMHYVMKQNPADASLLNNQVLSPRFTTVFPMVYRKTGVWLRFAEAINRAGYPSYAFAVLKNGLCNNDYWYPDAELDYPAKEQLYYGLYKDSVYLPYDIPVGGEIDVESILANGYCKNLAELDSVIREKYADTISLADVRVGSLILSTENFPTDYCQQVCYYLDKREVIKSKGIDYMNFMTRYMRSTTGSTDFLIKKELRNNGMPSSINYPSKAIENVYITTGVHARGGGRLRYNERNSSYDYVTQVCKKIKENTGREVTKEDIYSGDCDAEVQDAVEDLIIDECALEMAFEGNRFFDLMRVARRRGTDYLASRVAKRNGTFDQEMYDFLRTEQNWYLPFPVYE